MSQNGASHEVRGAKPGEVDAVVELCNLVFRPRGGDMLEEFPLLYHPDNANSLRTVWEGGKPISHAGYVASDVCMLGARLTVASVGAVCTHPDHRGQFHASRVMANLEATARQEGVSVMLVSGDRRLYRTLGCRRVGQYHTVRLPVEHLPTTRFQVRKAVEGDEPTLVRLQQTNAVRFERPADDWTAHLRSGFIMCALADTWIVERPGGPLAYLGVQRAGRDGRAVVQEYAGATAAVLDALRIAIGDATFVDVLGMPLDEDLPILAAAALPTVSQRDFGGTVKIIDPPRFFDAVQPLLFERGGEDIADGLLLAAGQDLVTFEWDGQELDVPTHELSRLIFGPAPGEEPLTVADGPLGPVLQRLFPLPLPLYGYNYI